MKKIERIALLELRLNRLTESDRDNNGVQRKILREIRNLKSKLNEE